MDAIAVQVVCGPYGSSGRRCRSQSTMTMAAVRNPSDNPFLRRPASAFGKPVCRLGLATRGDSSLAVDDVHHALARGVDFLNWPGTDDALGRAVAGLGSLRERVVVCAQFEARSAADAAHELRAMLATLGTDYLDVLTFYYVEEPAEWAQITGPGGALEYCRAARRDGVVRRLGLTTHQRPSRPRRRGAACSTR